MSLLFIDLLNPLLDKWNELFNIDLEDFFCKIVIFIYIELYFDFTLDIK